MSDKRCTALKLDGNPCRARPTPTGRCLNHEKGLAEAQAAHRREAGKASATLRSMAREKVAAIARLGVDALPDLSTVQKVQTYLVSIAARVEAGTLTQATALTGVVRLSKDMLALETDIKLLEELDAAKKGGR